jgi:hypothetical protein
MEDNWPLGMLSKSKTSADTISVIYIEFTCKLDMENKFLELLILGGHI